MRYFYIQYIVSFFKCTLGIGEEKMKKPLSINTLNELIRLCLINAERFIEDAELLIEDDSYGHAFALAILAEEELVKASIYHIGMCSTSTHRPDRLLHPVVLAC